MLSLALPWILLATPLPLILAWLWPPAEQRDAALRVPSLNPWSVSDNTAAANPKNNLFHRIILGLIWCALLIGAANPIWYGEPIRQQSQGRDILLAVDLSGSMRTQDMSLQGRRTTRLAASKSVISDFAKARHGDRLGLILFGSQAYMHVPLTADTQTLVQLLNEAKIGYAGRETAIGDAIGLGLKRLHTLDHTQRVLILLTDGSNTAGKLTPAQATQLASDAALKIYTIGVGARQGRQRIDEATLQAIAHTTGGQYFRAANTAQLKDIYQQIDKLEPTPDDAATVRPQKSLAWWLIAVALMLSALLCIVALLPTRRSSYADI